MREGESPDEPYLFFDAGGSAGASPSRAVSASRGGAAPGVVGPLRERKTAPCSLSPLVASPPRLTSNRGYPVLVTHHLSLIICHLSFVTYHPSLITRHSSPVTRHSSPVTHRLSLRQFPERKHTEFVSVFYNRSRAGGLLDFEFGTGNCDNRPR